MNNTLANEFTFRYFQLISDYKSHSTALNILEGEFRFKFEDKTTMPPTYFFIDNSCADYAEGGWDIFSNVNKPL